MSSVSCSIEEEYTMQEIKLRDARRTDVPKICDIHNQGIADRLATLDVESHTLEEQLQWFHRHGPRHPVVVAEAMGDIIGWVSLNRFSRRAAYRFVAHLSLYFHPHLPTHTIHHPLHHP